MQINTPKTLQSGIGVYFESGNGVVVTKWQWSVHSGVALECTLGVVSEWQRSVPPEWHWSASQICKFTLQCYSNGNGVVRMEWQLSVHFIATPTNFWKWHWRGDMWWQRIHKYEDETQKCIYLAVSFYEITTMIIACQIMWAITFSWIHKLIDI